MPVATTPIDMVKGADGTWSVPGPGEAAKQGNLVGPWAYQAGNFVAGPIARAITPAGCHPSDVVNTINNFLDWHGGLGKAAIVGAAFAFDPLVGIGANFAISQWSQGTEAGCAPGVPSPPATAQQVAALPPLIAAGPTVPLSISGLTSDQAARLNQIYFMLDTMADASIVFCQDNPLFLVVPIETGVGADTGRLYGRLGPVTLDTRNAGETTIAWLTRKTGSWLSWSDDGGGMLVGDVVGSATTFGQSAWVIWPHDAWASARDSVGWRRDFAQYYKWQVTPGVFWSVLGWMGSAFGAAGYSTDGSNEAPLTT